MFDFESKPSTICHSCGGRNPVCRIHNLDPHIREDDKQKEKSLTLNTSKKLFAGWLIDKAGLKGYTKNSFSIHKDHALIIIGNGKGSVTELLEFENNIKEKVFNLFEVKLEREPVIVE